MEVAWPALPHYGIRSDYIPNRVNLSLDSVSGTTYWTPERIARSGRHQFAAYAAAARLARTIGAGTVVDIGCGVATKLNHFFARDFDIIGIDQAPAIDLCRTLHTHGTYIAESFEAPRYELRSVAPAVDLLISSDVIEHLEDPDQLLSYIRAVVRESTHIVLTTPERHALLGRDARQPLNPAHIREWSWEEFRHYIEASGFTILAHRRLLPFRLQPDRMTLKFAIDRARRRLPFRTNQMVVCRAC